MNTTFSLMTEISVLSGLMVRVNFTQFVPEKSVKTFLVLGLGVLAVQVPSLIKDILIEQNQVIKENKGREREI